VSGFNAARYDDSFSTLERLYGRSAYRALRRLHICVIGLGGVGSWAVESLARTGVGKITLIDFDTIELSNINRQVIALDSTVGQKKHAALHDRIKGINPACTITIIDEFITENNTAELIQKTHQFNYVIDAIDSIKFKSHLIAHCRRNKIPIITTGGAGGLNDPSKISICDLSKTYNDPLASKVRSRLRQEYGFSKTKKFGVECVFSSQQQVYPKDDGTVGPEKPGIHGVSLDCRFGYGSTSFVTGTFGFFAAARAINKSLEKFLREQEEN